MLQKLMEYDRMYAGMSMQERSNFLNGVLGYINTYRATEDVSELLNALLVRAGELADDIPEVLKFKAEVIYAAIPLVDDEDIKGCRRIYDNMRKQLLALEQNNVAEPAPVVAPQAAPHPTADSKMVAAPKPMSKSEPVATEQQPIPVAVPQPVSQPQPVPHASKTPLDFLISADWEAANKKLGVLNIAYGIITMWAWCFCLVNFNFILLLILTIVAVAVRKAMNDQMLELIYIRKVSDQLEAERPDYKAVMLNVVKCTKKLSVKFWLPALAVAGIAFLSSERRAVVVIVAVINVLLCKMIHSKARKKAFKKAEGAADEVFKRKEAYIQKAA